MYGTLRSQLASGLNILTSMNAFTYLVKGNQRLIPRTYIAHQAEHRVLCWNRKGVKDFKEEVLDWS